MDVAHELPPRPLLPPAFAGACSACAAAYACLESAWTRQLAEQDVGHVGLLIALVGLATLLAGRSLAQGTVARWVAWCGAGLVLAGVSGQLYSGTLNAQFDSYAARAPSAFTYVVEGDPSPTSSGYSLHARAQDKNGNVVARVTMLCDERLEEGDCIQLVGRRRTLVDSDWNRSNYLQGRVGGITVVRIVRRKHAAVGPILELRKWVLERLDAASASNRALVAGLMCGRSTELKASGMKDSFSRAGVSHLIAVSGAHLAMVTSLCLAALEPLRLSRFRQNIAVGLVALVYALFTGLALSALRSLVMVVLGLVTGSFNRRRHGISALCLAVLGMVTVSPSSVVDLGFQLSVASVLFILLFSQYVASLLERAGVPATLAQMLSCTFCAQAGTLPISLPTFGSVSLIAPVSNMVLGPLISLLLPLCLVVVPIALAVPLPNVLLNVPLALASVTCFVTHLFAGMPFASIPVDMPLVCGAGVYVGAMALFALWPNMSGRAVRRLFAAVVVAAFVHVIRWNWFAPASVSILNVGQADSILIREGPATVLVDAGVDDQVLAALSRNNVWHLDTVVITHWDQDHWGGLPDVLETYPVGQIVVADGALDAAPDDVRQACEEKGVEITSSDRLRAGGFALVCVWPKTEVQGDENEESLCLDVTYDSGPKGLHVLLTGDTEQDEQQVYAADVGDIDVLKLGHHGSKVSVNDAVLQTLTPELCVASAGEGNRYRHPSQECQDATARAGAAFLCTKDVGDVVLQPATDGFRVTTQQGSE